MTLLIHQTPQKIINAFGADQAIATLIMAQIEKAGCWGYMEGDDIHLYRTKDCSRRDLIELFAHEISHRREPALKKLSGEDFAVINAKLCLKAFDLAMSI